MGIRLIRAHKKATKVSYGMSCSDIENKRSIHAQMTIEPTNFIKAEKLILIGQLYAGRLIGMFMIKKDKIKETYLGQVAEINTNCFSLMTF